MEGYPQHGDQHVDKTTIRAFAFRSHRPELWRVSTGWRRWRGSRYWRRGYNWQRTDRRRAHHGYNWQRNDWRRGYDWQRNDRRRAHRGYDWQRHEFERCRSTPRWRAALIKPKTCASQRRPSFNREGTPGGHPLPPPIERSRFSEISSKSPDIFTITFKRTTAPWATYPQLLPANGPAAQGKAKCSPNRPLSFHRAVCAVSSS
jgi:hypothetical protein